MTCRGNLLDLEFEMPIIRTALAKGDVSKVDEYLQYELDLFGVNLDRRSEAYRRLGMAILRRHVAALEAITQRTEGQPMDAPPLPVVGTPPAPTGGTLTAALEGWKRRRKPSPERWRIAAPRSDFLSNCTETCRWFKSERPMRGNFGKRCRRCQSSAAVNCSKRRWQSLHDGGASTQKHQKISANTVNKLLGGVQTVAAWARMNGIVPEEVHGQTLSQGCALVKARLSVAVRRLNCPSYG